MPEPAVEASPLLYARVAGLMALLTLISGSFTSSVYSRLVVPGDAETTANNIVASESLFRIGIVSALTMYVLFIPYALVLYKLLKPVNADHAVVMVTLALIGVPVAMHNQTNLSAVLLLATGGDQYGAFSVEQLQARAMFLLDVYKRGALIGVIFWGLWLFPLGLLVFNSGYFPRILGILLMIGCFGWLIVFVQRMLLPSHETLAYARFAAHVAELVWLLWLLIRGVNVERFKRRALEAL